MSKNKKSIHRLSELTAWHQRSLKLKLQEYCTSKFERLRLYALLAPHWKRCFGTRPHYIVAPLSLCTARNPRIGCCWRLKIHSVQHASGHLNSSHKVGSAVGAERCSAFFSSVLNIFDSAVQVATQNTLNCFWTGPGHGHTFSLTFGLSSIRMSACEPPCRCEKLSSKPLGLEFTVPIFRETLVDHLVYGDLAFSGSSQGWQCKPSKNGQAVSRWL